MINYRRDGVEKMDAKDIPAIANDALKVLGLEDLLKDAEVLFAPITVFEVTDDGIGEEFSIGGDIVYQQRYNGVEIENNFVRICVDKDSPINIRLNALLYFILKCMLNVLLSDYR